MSTPATTGRNTMVTMGMVIVAGYLVVDPDERDAYLESCRGVVEVARRTEGCLDFAVSADLVDPGRVNILERWESRDAVDAFRGDGPSGDQQRAITSGHV